MTKFTLHCVCDDKQRTRFIGWLVAAEESRPWLGVDTETTGLAWSDELRMVQFGDAEEGWALPFPEEKDLIADVLRDYRGDMVLHHAKFDARFLRNAGLPYERLWHDTKIMAHLLDSASSTSLKELGVRYLSFTADEGQKRLRQTMRKEKWTWATIPKTHPDYWQYAALDAVITARLADRLYPRVLERFSELYEMEMGVARAILDAEFRGVKLDREYVMRRAKELEATIDGIASQWPGINLNAPGQIAEVLSKDGVRVPATPKGNPSVTAEFLATIEHPLADAVVAFRQASKIRSTYFETFLEVADGRGYIHPIINTIGPRTGRMSCEQPNLQNVPRGSFVRPSLRASYESILVLADYRQIEYRLFASFANEQRMIQAFLEGKDMHTETARIILGHEPTEEERTVAKTANFAMLYGAGEDKFAATAGISLREATDFMARYKQEFPQVERFTKAVINYARTNNLSVETSYGRVCPVERGQLYAGVNYMIQGTAADVLKRAILRVTATEWGQYFILPVHDELIFDVPEEKADALVRALPSLMEEPSRFAVPLVIEVKRAHRWGLVEEVNE